MFEPALDQVGPLTFGAYQSITGTLLSQASVTERDARSRLLTGERAMSAETSSDLLPLIRKLEDVAPLTTDDKQALLDLPMHVREVGAGQDIIREGDRPSQCCLLLDGFAQRFKLLGDGRRQIMSFHIPGDMPDLLSLHLRVMDHSLATTAPSRLGFIAHQHLRQLVQQHPRLSDALWRDTLVDAAVFREWMVGIGRRSAYARIAHLVCELVTRMETAGLAQDNSISIPLTQGLIADALGLSTVHVNRVIQTLRANKLVVWRGKGLTVTDWEGLKRAGEFDPAYLHLGYDKAA
jgi:CRP-like cAMP-binding protein